MASIIKDSIKRLWNQLTNERQKKEVLNSIGGIPVGEYLETLNECDALQDEVACLMIRLRELTDTPRSPVKESPKAEQRAKVIWSGMLNGSARKRKLSGGEQSPPKRAK